MTSSDEGNIIKPTAIKTATGDTPLEIDETAKGGEIELDAHTQAAIGRRLKAVYSEIVQEPIPEQLLKLLDTLAAKERK